MSHNSVGKVLHLVCRRQREPGHLVCAGRDLRASVERKKVALLDADDDIPQDHDIKHREKVWPSWRKRPRKEAIPASLRISSVKHIVREVCGRRRSTPTGEASAHHASTLVPSERVVLHHQQSDITSRLPICPDVLGQLGFILAYLQNSAALAKVPPDLVLWKCSVESLNEFH